MSQPPQDRPDYPWGPGSTPDSSDSAGGQAAPTPPAPRYAEPAPKEAEQTPMSQTPPPRAAQPQPYTGTPATSKAPAPQAYGYTGQPSPGSDLAPGGFAGAPPAGRDGDRPGVAASTIVLLILSSVALLVFVWVLVGVVYAVPVALAIVSMVKSGTDPRGARTLAKAGWWTFIGFTVIGVALAVLGVALFASLINNSSVGSDPFDASSVALGHLTAFVR